jgi:hypothetical protein
LDDKAKGFWEGLLKSRKLGKAFKEEAKTKMRNQFVEHVLTDAPAYMYRYWKYGKGGSRLISLRGKDAKKIRKEKM